jgi:hypothetical protein
MPLRHAEKPARPTAPKPVFTKRDTLSHDQYLAKFAFDGEQSGDLSFKKGDVIEVTKSSDSRNVSTRTKFTSNLRIGGPVRLETERGYFLRIIWRKSEWPVHGILNGGAYFGLQI